MTAGSAIAAYSVAAALLTVTPGLDTALVLRTAAVEGKRRALLAMAGICLGCLVWGLIVSLGLGALLAVSGFAYNALRIAGACYLIYLGGQMLLRRRKFVEEEAETPGRSSRGATRWFARGLLTNLLNPKVGVFYVTFLPQFIPAGVNVMAFSMLLASIHVAEGILWLTGLTMATGLFSRWLRRPRVTKAFDRVTGAVLVGSGAALIFEGRR